MKHSDEIPAQKVAVEQFLEAIFVRYDPNAETPVVGQTRQRPKDNATVFWAHRWPVADLTAMHHASLALQKPTAPHQTSRKANFTGGIGIVLDDVFEKARAPILQPTWRMETSPGSEQWGYLFEEPLRDAVLHDQMIRALINGGLTDPGMSNIVRWFRLPGSQPLGKAHAARLVAWAPDRKFPADQLMEALGITNLPEPRRAANIRPDLKPDDEVLDWLNKTGRLRGGCSDGWWEVTCPRAHEHTGDDSRAYYLPVGDTNYTRGFNCFHSHQIGISEYLAWVVAQGGPKVQTTEASNLLSKLSPGVSGKSFFGRNQSRGAS